MPAWDEAPKRGKLAMQRRIQGWGETLGCKLGGMGFRYEDWKGIEPEDGGRKVAESFRKSSENRLAQKGRDGQGRQEGTAKTLKKKRSERNYGGPGAGEEFRATGKDSGTPLRNLRRGTPRPVSYTGKLEAHYCWNLGISVSFFF